MNTKIYACLLLFTLLTACKKDNEKPVEDVTENTLFTLLPSQETGVSFVNKIVNQKNFNIFKYRNFYNGGGVGIGDVNNDGLPDIYLTGNQVSNKLFLNKGNMVFEDITDKAGVGGSKPWSTGVTVVDVNQDSFLDIYVSNAGNMEGNNHDNDLYINNGDLTFTEKAAEYNLAKTGFSTHAAFFDYDKDGDLDAYILNNSNIPISSLGYAEQRNVRAQDWEGVPDIFKGVGDMLLRNDNGKFTDVSEEANIYGSLIGFGLGVITSDFNHDNWPDIYVSNDFYERDYLYINNQDGTFTEDIKSWASHLCLSAMGVDVADINNDGLNDIFITDMLPNGDQRIKSVMEFEGYNIFKLKQSKDFYQQYIQNTLQLNNGNNSFSEIAFYSGVADTDWSWAGLLFDMDNDGYRDIYVTNGINHDLTDLDFVDFFANEIIQKMALTGKKEAIDSIIEKMPIVKLSNYAYKNNRDLTFTNEAKKWGLEIPSMSNGAAYADLDNDGDLDLVVNNVNMETFVYRNNAEKTTNNTFIKFKLDGPNANKFGIGATVKVHVGNAVILQEQTSARGFQSSVDYVMTLGLGTAKNIDSVRVIWPDDRSQKLENLKPNQLVTLKHSESTETFKPQKNSKKTLLQELPNKQLVKHEENAYTDFDFEGLISKMVSQEGPTLSVGDVNGDGSEDVFIGGAKNQPASLYLNQGNGSLVPSKNKVFTEDAAFEDSASAFFDADGDGDLDLMVGSGGNEDKEGKSHQTRLYLNDDKGNFSKATVTIPTVYQNTSILAPHDFDGDGDMDVFTGSRSVPGIYGISPKHLLLENDGQGNFKDVAESKAFDLKNAGMVTDAVWADVDGDTKKDLVLVGDWMAPMVLKSAGRRLSLLKTNLENFPGWYNTVTAADLDNDGDLDLVLGNHGQNMMYRPTQDAPMKMFINDFDNNGTIEQIVTQTINGRDTPLHQKKELTTQIVSLKKQNLKASEYAKKNIQELFPAEVFGNSIVKTVTTPATLVAMNNGKGNFNLNELPAQVQFSCVCGIVCQDINKDGNLDLVMAGNNYEFKPQYSRLDANYGSVLLGNGKGGFEWQNYNTSGFFVKGEVKHLKPFKDKNGNIFLISAINNEQPRIFKVNEQ